MPRKRSRFRKNLRRIQHSHEENNTVQSFSRRLSDPGGWGYCANYASTFWVGSAAEFRNAIACAEMYAAGLEQIFILYITADIRFQQEAEADFGVAIAFPYDDLITERRNVIVSVRGHPAGTKRVIGRDVTLGRNSPAFSLFDVYGQEFSRGTLQYVSVLAFVLLFSLPCKSYSRLHALRIFVLERFIDIILEGGYYPSTGAHEYSGGIYSAVCAFTLKIGNGYVHYSLYTCFYVKVLSDSILFPSSWSVKQGGHVYLYNSVVRNMFGVRNVQGHGMLLTQTEAFLN